MAQAIVRYGMPSRNPECMGRVFQKNQSVWLFMAAEKSAMVAIVFPRLNFFWRPILVLIVLVCAAKPSAIFPTHKPGRKS
jgi:hypothetical protein